MGKRNLILIMISIILIVFAFSFMNQDEEVVESPIHIEVGQEFTGIRYSQTKYVLNYKIADFNGDAVNDVVIFVGEKESMEATKVKNADIVLYDGALQKYTNADLKKFEGESPRLELSDLTGDSLQDIVALLNDENGEKVIRVMTLENESLKEIFKAKDNKLIRFTGNLLDGFKVNVTNRKLNVNQELDLSGLSTSLIENGIFDNSGKYLNTNSISIRTTGFVEIEFVQLTGSMGMKTKQRIVTSDDKVIIDEISIVWKFEEGKWQMKEATGLKLGNLLY